MDTETEYAWQDDCVRKWLSAGGRGIVSAVTGAGKTRMAVRAAEALVGNCTGKLCVYVVTPTKALRQQWERILRKRAVLEGRCEVFVIHAARYRLARMILERLRSGNDVLLIADECHHYASEENRKIFEFVPLVPRLQGDYYALGLTATLEKKGYREVLSEALGKVIYSYDLAHARRRGTVAEFVIYQIALFFTEDEQQEYEELTEEMRLTRSALMKREPFLRHCEPSQFFDILKELAAGADAKSARLALRYMNLAYKRKRLVCMASSRIECVCRLLAKLDVRGGILIFGESIEQAEQLYAALKLRCAGTVGRYHSKMGERANKNTLDRFRSGEVRILITCRALDEGIDVPEAAVAIVLSGTGVKRQRMQRLGRILRRTGEEKIARLYYLFVADSAEERVFLPDKGDAFQTEELIFQADEIFYPAYDKAAERMLTDLRKKHAGEEIFAETLRCLEAGEWKTDWLLGETRQNERLRQAQSRAEKNYWICMRQMGRYKKMC